MVCLLVLIVSLIFGDVHCQFHPFHNRDSIPVFEVHEGIGLLEIKEAVNNGKKHGGLEYNDDDEDKFGGGSWREVVVEQGFNLSITCTLHNTRVLQVLRLRWKNADQLLTISDNNDFKTPFSLISRYSLHYTSTNNTTTLLLHYKGVMGEDSGVLECVNLPSFSSFLKLSVIVPPQRVELSYLEDTEWKPWHSTVSWDHQQFFLFRCTSWVLSSTLPPAIHLTINHHPAPFHLSRTTRRVYSAQALEQYNSSTTATINISTTHLHHTNTITCTASSHQLLPPKFITTTLTFHYAPAISCASRYHRINLGANVTLQCQVHSNPPPLVQWYFKGKLLSGDNYGFHSDFNYSHQHEIRYNNQQHNINSDGNQYNIQQYNFENHQQPNNQYNNNNNNIGLVSKYIATYTSANISNEELGNYLVVATNSLGSSQDRIRISKIPALSKKKNKTMPLRRRMKFRLRGCVIKTTHLHISFILLALCLPAL